MARVREEEKRVKVIYMPDGSRFNRGGSAAMPDMRNDARILNTDDWCEMKRGYAMVHCEGDIHVRVPLAMALVWDEPMPEPVLEGPDPPLTRAERPGREPVEQRHPADLSTDEEREHMEEEAERESQEHRRQMEEEIDAQRHVQPVTMETEDAVDSEVGEKA